MKYELFFFKEHNRTFDIKSFLSYLEDIGFAQAATQNEFSLKYHNLDLPIDAAIVFTKVSRVPDLHLLSPKFFDLNFHFALDPLMPTFKAKHIFSIVKDITAKFTLRIYNVLFEEVASFQNDILVTSYEMYKTHYKKEHQLEYASLNYVSEKKLNEYCRYQLEYSKLNKYFEADEYYFPPLSFVKQDTVILAKTVIPYMRVFAIPLNVDLLAFVLDDYLRVIKTDDFTRYFAKYLKDIPGTIPGMKVIMKKKMKKIFKCVAKGKIAEYEGRMQNVDMESLIDL